MDGEIEPQRPYLAREMKSPLVTHLLLALCVCVRLMSIMSIDAEAFGFPLSTAEAI